MTPSAYMKKYKVDVLIEKGAWATQDDPVTPTYDILSVVVKDHIIGGDVRRSPGHPIVKSHVLFMPFMARTGAIVRLRDAAGEQAVCDLKEIRNSMKGK